MTDENITLITEIAATRLSMIRLGISKKNVDKLLKCMFDCGIDISINAIKLMESGRG